MNYELALKLKEAGFPQLGSGRELLLDKPLLESDETVTSMSRERYCTSNIERNKHGVDVYAPTLEELIEACQPELLVKRSPTINPFWEAYKENGKGFNGAGITPTEAVAHLWLALNNTTHLIVGCVVYISTTISAISRARDAVNERRELSFSSCTKSVTSIRQKNFSRL